MTETPDRPTSLVQLGRLVQETLNPGYNSADKASARCPIAGQKEDDLKGPLSTGDAASSSTGLAFRSASGGPPHPVS